MAYCVKCGAKVDDGIRFCPCCGAEIPLGQGQYGQQGQGQDQQYYDHGGQQSQYGQQGPYGQQREGYFHPEDVRANKVMAVLSYIGILVLVPLLAGNKSSEYLRHHIDQGLVIWIGSLLADILSGGGFLGFAFFSSVWSLELVGGILSLVFFILMIVGIVDACRGVRRELPVVGAFKIL